MRLCLIVNPNAGRKRGVEVAAHIASLLGEAGVQCERRVSEHPGGTRELADELDPSQWDGVVAVGGDGTLFEVVNGLVNGSCPLSIPIGQVPVGTGNSFLRDLGIGAPGDVVRCIMEGRIREVDLGRFSSAAGSFYFANLLGAGFVSNVAYRARKYKALGSLSYLLGVVEEVTRLRSTRTRIVVDGQTFDRDAIFVEICNSRFTGGSMMMAPAAKIDDGLLDVVVLNRVTRRRLLQLLPTIFSGTHVDAPEVEVFRGSEIRLESDAPLALTPDGETFGRTPINVKVHPARIRMFA